MCGISGLISNNFTSKNLYKIGSVMLERILYRGPDQKKILVKNNSVFGTVRLAIEAIKFGEQPIEKDGFIVGFNGEIFNYKDLSKEFFPNKKINSEIELILNLWKLKRDGITNYVKGQYVIFIYEIATNKIKIFRDPYGIRPLFYYLDNNKNFYFSSEIKSIISASNDSFNLSQRSLAYVSMFWTNIGSHTSFENIYSLEPGHTLEFSNNRIKVKRFFEPFIFNKNYDNFIDEKDIFEELNKAVKNQLHGDVGYATYLSGGIDSSALSYILSKNSKKKIDAFSISFDDQSYDESYFQKKICKYLDLNHYSLKINKYDISKIFPKVVNHAETVLFRTAPAPMYLLSKLVRSKGHKVVFTGEGADEMLLGYDIFFENRIRRLWAKDKSSLKIPKLFHKLYYYLPQFKNSRYFEMIKDFYKSTLKKDNHIFFSHFVRWSQYRQVKTYFNLNSSAFDENKLFLDLEKNIPKAFFKASSDIKAQYLEISTLMSNYLLSSQGDRMTMANSVEGRYPFLDENFTKFTSKISPIKKAPAIKSKDLFRKAFIGKFPREIVFRPKIAYQAPEARSFINEGFVTPEAENFLDNLTKIDTIEKKNFKGLVKKLKNPLTSKRVGFRENMAFVMGVSLFYLKKNMESWIEKK